MPTGNADKEQFEAIAAKGSQAVQQAASVLEQELSAGLVGMRKVTQGFAEDHRVDNDGFDQLVKRFRSTAHQLLRSCE